MISAGSRNESLACATLHHQFERDVEKLTSADIAYRLARSARWPVWELSTFAVGWCGVVLPTWEVQMSQPDDRLEALQARVTEQIGKSWKAFLIEGILLVILGLAALLLPPLASIAVTIFLGWLFLISGVAGLVLTFWARETPGFWWSLISAAAAIIAGVVLLVWPIQGTLTLTLVVGAYFIAEGVATIMFALEHRKRLTGRWGWLIASGIADLAVAAIIIIGLPGSALWALGLLVGLNLLFGGSALIGLALSARNQA